MNLPNVLFLGGGGGLQGPIAQVIRPCFIAELSVKRLCHGQQKEKRAWHP